VVTLRLKTCGADKVYAPIPLVLNAIKSLPQWKEDLVAFIEWFAIHTNLGASHYHFLREATAGYPEKCACWLFNSGVKVSIVNPAHVKYYGQNLDVHSQNNTKDSVVLARYGLM